MPSHDLEDIGTMLVDLVAMVADLTSRFNTMQATMSRIEDEQQEHAAMLSTVLTTQQGDGEAASLREHEAGPVEPSDSQVPLTAIAHSDTIGEMREEFGLLNDKLDDVLKRLRR